MAEPQLPEPLAQSILIAALKERRASEMLSCLFDGGSATVDAVTYKLVLISGEQLKDLGTKPSWENELTTP